jgi:serine/threonine protein kinase
VTREDWTRLFEVFHGSRERSGDARMAYLRQECAGDPSLIEAVEQLLYEDENAGSFLSHPFSGLRRSKTSRISEGQEFGRYTVTSFLGRGGMGEVWRGYDRDLDRPVALKFLTTGFGADQLTREARHASALNHPGIVTVHEVLALEQTPLMVMELVEGSPLSNLPKGPAEIRNLLPLLVHIAEALAAAHARGIIHGDLKPDNILVRSDGFTKVLDFGLARRVTAENIATGGLMAGTLIYMSPEQARGEPLTPATDVFSFGLLTFELITGKHPFGRSGIDAVQTMLREPAPRPSKVARSVGHEWDFLLGAMLQPDATRRISMADVEGQIRGIHQKSPSGRRWLIAAFSVVLLLLVASLAWISRRPPVAESTRRPVPRRITWAEPATRLTAAAMSPIGGLVAYANAEGLFVRTADAVIHKLQSPADFSVDRLSWLPDESGVIASGLATRSNRPGIWHISRTGGSKQVRESARDAVVSPDGRRVAFLNQSNSEIWVTEVNGGQPRRVLQTGRDESLTSLVWLPGGRFLGVQQNTRRSTARAQDPDAAANHTFLSVDHTDGRVVHREDLWVYEAATTGDGRLLFLRPNFDRNRYVQHDQVWEIGVDLNSGSLRSPARLLADLSNPDESTEHVRGLSTSKDGRQMVLLRYTDAIAMFSAEFLRHPPRLGAPRRLTHDARSSYPHSWTLDSQAVLFESNRSGNYDIYKLPLAARTPELLVASAEWEFMPQSTPDGGSVLFYRREAPVPPKPIVYHLGRVGINGGPAGDVPIGAPLDEFRCGTRPGSGCVLRDRVDDKEFVFYDLDPVTGRGKELARTARTRTILGDWALSPDGTQVAIPIHSPDMAKIQIVTLRPRNGLVSQREVDVPGLTNLLGLHWSTSRDGWFATFTTSLGSRCVFVDPDGRFHPLGEMQGWALPSPDGKRVVFTDSNVAANAILVEVP